MTRKIKLRSLFVGSVITLLFFGVFYRLYTIQVVQADMLAERAERVWETSSVLQPKRGAILDRNGRILAEHAQAYTVAVNPQLIYDRKMVQEVVRGLAPMLEMSEDKLYSIVTSKREDGKLFQHREVRNEGWKIDKQVADRIQQWRDENKIPGVYLIEQHKRYYPSGSLAAHVLGYYDKEDRAVYGIESAFDDILRGQAGQIRYSRDRLGFELPNAESRIEPAVNGMDIRLTIDQNIQHYIERAMEKKFAEYGPKSMTVIAADPNTMEILGMANLPTFDPNIYWDFSSHSDFFNHAVSSQYEPGSTFKIVTLAGSVEEGQFKAEDTFRSGSIQVGGRTLRDHNYGRGWGDITYLMGLLKSSNVGFVKMGIEGLGQETFHSYINRFGFGQRTGIDLAGELPGTVRMRYTAEYATATYGQGLAVTPIQMVTAVAAVANGGKLLQPYIVKDILDPKSGEIVQSNKPTLVREVISPETAREVGLLLEQTVVDPEGTARRAAISGFRVAGKTGTANKVVNGEYSQDSWVVSFVGYAPVDNPRVILYVLADEPELGGNYQNAGGVATPLFQEIMSDILNYLGVASEPKAMTTRVLSTPGHMTVPDLNGMQVESAKNEVEKRQLIHEIFGSGDQVTGQFPAPGTEIGSGGRIYVITGKKADIGILELLGKSLREALEICSLLELKCEFTGEGYVIGQSVRGDTVIVELAPYRVLLERLLAPSG